MADGKTLALVGGVLVLLAAATGAGQFLKLYPESGLNAAVVRSFNLRLRAWWLMCSVLAAALLIGDTATVVLFGAISFWALREFITLTPTRLGDHRALFWVFVLFTPLQYVLIGRMRHSRYELYNVLIPVYAFLFILARVAVSGDYKRFLERTAKIQAGLLICVYCLSFAPALLYLDLKPGESQGANVRLLFFFILMVQVSDGLHFLWSRLVGRHVIAAAISPSKTWEGFLGGTASATLLGAALWWATPFEPWGAAGISLLISVMGFAGGMTMSAIKRDRGVKDYGTLVEGHGGVLDRIDSLCFAAPVVFHVMQLFFPLQQP
ncbi:MAG TPA: phosphatidate cytidylyltransferase [Pirellulales bacterium]|jgi:phosphatidate cytidylyltransferase|nr:phosphatidate cytidylyltransferase [Pirellulales bacterium]